MGFQGQKNHFLTFGWPLTTKAFPPQIKVNIFNIFYLTYLLLLLFKTIIIRIFGVRKPISQQTFGWPPTPPYPQN